MSDGHTLIIGHNRETIHRVIDAAPKGSVVTVKPSRRTLDQNARMWAMLSEVSRAKPQGRDYPPAIWKDLFMAHAGHQARWEPALDGNGVVNTGYRSSRLSKAEMSDVVEAIYSYGAEHGVKFQETV